MIILYNVQQSHVSVGRIILKKVQKATQVGSANSSSLEQFCHQKQTWASTNEKNKSWATLTKACASQH